MEEAIFMEVANEIKGLHNSAISYIKEANYQQARAQYEKAITITDKIFYHEGKAMTLFNMANLALLQKDYCQALVCAEQARVLFLQQQKEAAQCEELGVAVMPVVKQQAIELERKGRFKEAVLHFVACLPFAEQSVKQAMEHEIKLLEKIINDRK